MATWNEKDPACKSIYEILKNRDQFQDDFTNAENLKMYQLSFYANLASGAMATGRISVFAQDIDRDLCGNPYNATRKNGQNMDAVIKKIVGVLRKSDNTVAALANTIGENYEFPA